MWGKPKWAVEERAFQVEYRASAGGTWGAGEWCGYGWSTGD